MELVYNSSCQPKGWEGYFNRPDVVAMIQEISDRLKYDSREQGLGLNPDIGWIFRAFYMVPPDQMKAIILDPAPEPGLATGLAFSLAPTVHPTKVPSVQRVILEARNEGYCVDPENGVLVSWAEQGVLLLNTALTLIQNEIASHLELWKEFTDEVITYINDNANPSVWILWGSKAKAFEEKIDKKYFFLQNYFTCANEWLCKKGRSMVEWNLVPLPSQKYASRLYDRVYCYPGFANGKKCKMQACPLF